MNNQLVVDGQLVSYLELGERRAQQTLVFLHGWRSNKEVWNMVIKRLISTSANQPIRIYSIDLPGFGGSPAPKGEWGVGDYAELVGGFIKKLELKNVVIIGHSFGGRIAIKLASSRVDIIKKVVLVDAAGFVMDSNKKAAAGLAAKIVKPLFKPKFMQGLRKKIYKQIGAEDYVATPELQKIFVKVVNEDLTENMKRILQPTLIVWGEDDEETPVRMGEKIKFEIRNSKFEILSNAGHFSFVDRPTEFVKALTSFLG